MATDEISGPGGSNDIIKIYHGSSRIIKAPDYLFENKNTDYGHGFYTTQNKGLSGEWAVLNSGMDGFINEYTLNCSALKILNLEEYPVEVWMATLMLNRQGEYNDVVQERQRAFVKKFSIDISEYDVIKGYRANDSFFTYVRDFLSVGLSKEKLTEAMRFGDLGIQICLKSKKAYETVKYITHYKASVKQYYNSAKFRDDEARKQYRLLKNKTKGTTVLDMIGDEDD